MSTILDALRKVERDRELSADQVVDRPSSAPEARRRRRFPVVPVLLCALLGFVGGAVLSWLTSETTPQVEVAALPVPPPPPAIPVPRAPERNKPAAGEPASAPVAAAEPAPPGGDAPPAAVAVEKPAVPAAPAAVAALPPPAAVEHAPAEMLATIDKQASALEPSPFSPPREAARDGASTAEPANPAPPPAAPHAAPAGEGVGTDVAALPPTLDEPAIDDAAPESEPEPETPVETLVDTGRSPPGAPKVALSFLQWSVDPARRFAFVSIDGQPSQRIREGEVAAGLTVAVITKNGVQFKREGTTFMIRPRH